MERLSSLVLFLCVVFEIFLIGFYFLVLLPSYNQAEYETPTLSEGSIPKCSMFVTQKEAQRFFNRFSNSIDNIDQLDNDRDGQVCENLP